jgi:hypothetical protein
MKRAFPPDRDGTFNEEVGYIKPVAGIGIIPRVATAFRLIKRTPTGQLKDLMWPVKCVY